MKFLGFYLILSFFFLIFAEPNLEIKNTSEIQTKEYKGYVAKKIESITDEIFLYIDYSEEYRPLGIEFQTFEVKINSKKWNAYQINPYFSQNVKDKVANYGQNMQLLFTSQTITDYKVYVIENNLIQLTQEINSKDIKEGRVSLQKSIDLMSNSEKNKKIVKPILLILSTNDSNELEKSILPSEVSTKELSADATPFDTEFNEQDSPNSFQSLYGSVPRFVMFKKENQFGVCYQDIKTNDILIQEFNSKDEVINKLKIKSQFNLFAGCTVDENENYYILVAKENKEGDFSSNLRLLKLNKKGKELGRFEPNIDRNNFDIMKPMSSSSSVLVYKDNLVGILIGKTQFKGKDGLNHQSSVFIAVNTKTMKLEETISQKWIASHSFDQKLIHDGNHFISLDLADNFPRGFSFRKIGKGNPAVVFTYKTKHNSNNTSNDNRTYSELGGILNLDSSYLVLGSSEKNFDNSKTNENLNDSRNLFILEIAKDFETKEIIGKSGKKQNHIVNPEVVISKGEDSKEIGFYDYSGNLNLQKRIGIIWLTDYANKKTENARRPKLIPISNNRILILWEKWSDSKFISTEYRILEKTGKIHAQKNLGSIRLTRTDSVIEWQNNILWFIGNENRKMLKLYKVSIPPVE
jgi:hypothetical protein